MDYQIPTECPSALGWVENYINDILAFIYYFSVYVAYIACITYIIGKWGYHKLPDSVYLCIQCTGVKQHCVTTLP